MKKLLLSLGALAAVTSSAIIVSSCETWEPESKKKPDSAFHGIDLTNATKETWHSIFHKSGGRSTPEVGTIFGVMVDGKMITYTWTSDDNNGITSFISGTAWDGKQATVVKYLAEKLGGGDAEVAAKAYAAFGFEEGNMHSIPASLPGASSSTQHSSVNVATPKWFETKEEPSEVVEIASYEIGAYQGLFPVVLSDIPAENFSYKIWVIDGKRRRTIIVTKADGTRDIYFVATVEATGKFGIWKNGVELPADNPLVVGINTPSHHGSSQHSAPKWFETKEEPSEVAEIPSYELGAYQSVFSAVLSDVPAENISYKIWVINGKRRRTIIVTKADGTKDIYFMATIEATGKYGVWKNGVELPADNPLVAGFNTSSHHGAPSGDTHGHSAASKTVDLTNSDQGVWHANFRDGSPVGTTFTITVDGQVLSYTWTEADAGSRTQQELFDYICEKLAKGDHALALKVFAAMGNTVSTNMMHGVTGLSAVKDPAKTTDLTNAQMETWHSLFRTPEMTRMLPAVGDIITVTVDGKKLSYTWTQEDTDGIGADFTSYTKNQNEMVNYLADKLAKGDNALSAKVFAAFGFQPTGNYHSIAAQNVA